jgi:cytochrome bd-type quinol oxidase subunit 2
MDDVLSWLWWSTMASISLANIWYFVSHQHKLRADDTTNRYITQMKVLAGIYVFGCAFRTILPRIDVDRICFFDTFLSYVFLGRSVATIAELAYVRQVSLAVYQVAQDVIRSKQSLLLSIIHAITTISVIAIAVAQCCCWLGITTRNNFFHCIEESLWMLTFAALTLCAVAIYFKLLSASKDNNDQLNTVKTFLRGLIFVGPAFVTYMCFVDIPMYYRRYLEDQQKHGGSGYLSIYDGLASSLKCEVVTRDFYIWREDMDDWIF